MTYEFKFKLLLMDGTWVHLNPPFAVLPDGEWEAKITAPEYTPLKEMIDRPRRKPRIPNEDPD